jgi:hypothetical protein
MKAYIFSYLTRFLIYRSAAKKAHKVVRVRQSQNLVNCRGNISAYKRRGKLRFFISADLGR